MTAVINSENLANVFRSLTQKRRSGVLEIQFDGREVSLLINAGKIVGALEKSREVRDGILATLERAELLPAGFDREAFLSQQVGRQQVDWQETDWEKQLLSMGVRSEDLRIARSVYERNVLNSVRQLRNGQYDFRSSSVQREFLLDWQITPAQVLMDFVQFDEDEKLFHALFGDLEGDTRICRASDTEEPEAAFDRAVEREIISALELSQSIVQLRNKFLVSDFEFQSAILKLHEKSLIDVAETELHEVAIPIPAVVAESPSDRTISQTDVLEKENKPELEFQAALASLESLKPKSKAKKSARISARKKAATVKAEVNTSSTDALDDTAQNISKTMPTIEGTYCADTDSSLSDGVAAESTQPIFSLDFTRISLPYVFLIVASIWGSLLLRSWFVAVEVFTSQ